MIKFIFWTLLALLIVVCCVIDVIGQNWFALSVSFIALILDSAESFFAFKQWYNNNKKEFLGGKRK
jgi:hypothetical protein